MFGRDGYIPFWPDFDAAMRELVPDMHDDARVYAVDGGPPGCMRTTLSAAALEGPADAPRVIAGTETERAVPKHWLAAFCEERARKRLAPDENYDDIEVESPFESDRPPELG